MNREPKRLACITQGLVSTAHRDRDPNPLQRDRDPLVEGSDERLPRLVVTDVLHRPLVERCDYKIGECGLFDVLPGIVGADRLLLLAQMINSKGSGRQCCC